MTHQPLHPTPQFARDGWHDLSGPWQFAYDDADHGLDERWYRVDHHLSGTIRVPFPPESAASGVGDRGFHRVLWYRRTAAIDPAQGDERVLLHFGAVDYRAQVYLNGQFVAEHSGGMTPFTVDVTAYLGTDDEQVLVVRVEDDPRDLSQPRGKQDWRTRTEGIFYERTSGIWQPVWYERVNADHVVDVAWTTDFTTARIHAEVRLSHTPRVETFTRIRLRQGDTVLADQTVRLHNQVETVTIHLPVLGMPMERKRMLWSPEHPNLIDAQIELTVGGQRTDRVESYVGVRSAGFSDGRFTLNGHPYYLRLVLEQGYWPDTHLAAPDEAALRAEVEAIKALGFNGARIHQKVEDPRFLYWCDRLGLLIWGEMANAFVFTDDAMRRLTTEWLDVVRRDRSHPCVVAWIPINESWGVPHIADDPAQRHFASAIYHLTKALDPTRPAVSNEGWEHTESDIWGIHDYTPEAQSIEERYGSSEALDRTLTDRSPGRRRVLLGDRVDHGQPIMITEFGGLSYTPEQGENWFGYSTIDSDAAYLKLLDELVSAITDLPDVAGFCYTQLTDTAQETNGLLRADRSPKLPVEDVRAVITRPSRAIPSEAIDSHRRAAQPPGHDQS